MTPSLSEKLASIRVRTDLEAFLGTHPESGDLEYKTLADLYRCSSCAYCRNPRSRSGGAEDADEPAGVKIARAASSLANSRGGAIVIGARIVNRESGQHTLQDQSCASHEYSPEMVAQHLSRLCSPPVEPRIQVVSQVGSPPAFLVLLYESRLLHGWRNDTNGYLRFSTRFGPITSPMNGMEVEFVVRNKATYRDNAELRGNVLNETMGLFYHTFDWPERRAGGREWYTAYDGIIAENPSRCMQLEVRLPFWDIHQEVEDLIGMMPSKIVALQAPHDVTAEVRKLVKIEVATPHSTLHPSESRLFSVARAIDEWPDLERELDPMSRIKPVLEAEEERVRDHFYQSTAPRAYATTFREAFESYRTANGQPLNAGLYRHAVGGLANALSGLLPSGMRVLAFYSELRERLGPEALGIDETEDRWYRIG